MTWLYSAGLFVVMFGFGGFVVAKLVIDARRDRRTWSGPSLTAEEAKAIGGDLQDPAAAGSTAGGAINATDAWAQSQAMPRVIGNNDSMYTLGPS
jgi:hypothetical protein